MKTIRDNTRAALDAALALGVITSGELLTVLDFWNERDSYDQNPYAVFHDGYFDRETRAGEIMRRAEDCGPGAYGSTANGMGANGQRYYLILRAGAYIITAAGEFTSEVIHTTDEAEALARFREFLKGDR